MSSCFGFRKTKGEDTEALLPQYEDDTSLQRSLHQKMHSYQMIRALSAGFMPSTEQLIINLRTLLASDVLNPDNPDLSDSGRLLLKFTKRWLSQFIEVIRHKNDSDQIQDFIWFLSKSKISLDTEDITRSAKNVKAKADATAGTFAIVCNDFHLLMRAQHTKAYARLAACSSRILISGCSLGTWVRLVVKSSRTQRIRSLGSRKRPGKQ